MPLLLVQLVQWKPKAIRIIVMEPRDYSQRIMNNI